MLRIHQPPEDVSDAIRKLELLHDLTMFFLSADDIQIRPESVLGTCESSPNRAAADIAVRRGSQEVLIELKTFPTNYGGVGKPITNFIASVVRDLEKLCARRGSATGLVAWLAYPIPAPIPPSWSQHLGKIEDAAAITRRSHRVEVLHNKFVHLYVMDCK